MIAEIGANHNRDMGVATELIDAAAAAGADAVKFQTYSGERIYSRKTPSFDYLQTDEPPAELLERISLPREWQAPLADHAASRGVQFFSSPFDHEAVAELAALDVPALKIASFEIVDLPLIERAAATGIPLIISTGMAVLGEVEEALEAARRGGASAVGLMQTHVGLPRARRAGQPAGDGHHARGVRRAGGPLRPHGGHRGADRRRRAGRRLRGEALHARPLDGGPRPPVRARAGRAARRWSRASAPRRPRWATGARTGPSEEERHEMYTLARRSLIVTRDLPAGTVLERDMLTVKRPGFGVPPKHLDLVLGRALRVDVEDDDILTWEML